MADSTQPGEPDNDDSRKARMREYRRLYYQKNKSRILEKNKAWFVANKDRHKALTKANRAANKERDRERQRRWRAENPERAAAAQKRYRQKNKELLQNRREQNRERARAYSKAHYAKNIDSYRTRRQDYRKKNRSKLQSASRAYYLENRDTILEKHKQYRANNRNLTTEQNRKYQKQKWQHDLEYWLKKTVARRMRDALSAKGVKKGDRTIRLIGCSAIRLASHLESLFQPGMTWENRGRHGWHIDHIIPLAKFDLTDPEQQAAAFHYTNLQPLWARDNLSKSDKVPGQLAFGFAYAAKIADAASAKPKRRRKDGGQHSNH